MRFYKCETCTRPFKANESGHCQACRLAYVRRTFSLMRRADVPMNVQKFAENRIRALEAI
jgi:DNA-directed RNA polymerase subunit RPC12/RpoP